MTTNILSAERLQELLHYDPETGIFTRRISRRKWKAGDVAGSPTKYGYVDISIDGRTYRAHRLAWLYVYGSFPEADTDHLNGQRDDNRLCNLRACSRSENMQNQRKPRSNNKSGFLGVCLVAPGKWKAEIKIGGERRALGVFESAEMAHDEYLRAKAANHEFSTLDHPGGDMRPTRSYTSEHVGVCWNKASKRWMARIQINGKSYFLGLFQTAALAHAAYLSAKREPNELGVM